MIKINKKQNVLQDFYLGDHTVDRNKYLSFMSFLKSSDSKLCRETYDELLRIGADDERLTKIIEVAWDPSVSRKLDFLSMEYQIKKAPYKKKPLLDDLWEKKLDEPRKKETGYFDLLKKEASKMVEAYMRVINDPYAPAGFKEQARKVPESHWAPMKEGLESLDKSGAFEFDIVQDPKRERIFSEIIFELVDHFKGLYDKDFDKKRGDTYGTWESSYKLCLRVMRCAYSKWCGKLTLEQVRSRYDNQLSYR